MTVAATAAAAAPATSSPGTALGSLTSNVGDFLSLLMTQLKNQDPTSPMDTNAFTSQLVQYASVEQQINANANLTKLIEATQSNTVLQSSSIIGKQVQVKGDHLSLQDGQAQVNFTTPTAQTVRVGIYSDTGAKIREATVKSSVGDNTWSWNGKDGAGSSVPDGSYKVVVIDPSGTALTTISSGRVTGIKRSGTTVNVSLGALSTSVGNIQSVTDGS